jgi:2-dehydropantoate 2-reductase
MRRKDALRGSTGKNGTPGETVAAGGMAFPIVVVGLAAAPDGSAAASGQRHQGSGIGIALVSARRAPYHRCAATLARTDPRAAIRRPAVQAARRTQAQENGMKVAVMGAGAVGCYFGAMLARAGHEVALVGRPAHVDAIRAKGLFLDTRAFQAYIPMQAGTDPGIAGGASVVLFCVKSADTESAGRALAPYLAPGTLVLSLQNGVDNAERLQAILPQTVVPAVVYVATEMAGPGHVKHHGRGELVIGPSSGSRQFADACAAAGIPVDISDNVIGALWAKLIVNCAYNAMSAIARLPYGELYKGQGVEQVMRDVVHECLAVAQAEGITVPGDSWEAVLKIVETMPTQFSSTAQDMARGKATEIDYLNGYVDRKGRERAIATPVNRTLHALVKLLENRPATRA